VKAWFSLTKILARVVLLTLTVAVVCECFWHTPDGRSLS